MTGQWEDPKFRAIVVETSRETMTRLHTDPEFAARHAARSSKRMARLNADPEFKAKQVPVASERMTRQWKDLGFRAKVVEAARERGKETGRERMTQLNADPEFVAANSRRTKQRWAEYRALKTQLTAQAPNGDRSSSVSVENLPRYGRPRGTKRAITLTPDK